MPRCECGRAATERWEDEPVCGPCFDTKNDRAHARLIADFYGGDGPSESDRADLARDTGRRRW